MKKRSIFVIASGFLPVLLTPAPAWASQSDTLRPGELITCGNSITSASQAYRAVMQCDGNLVVYGPGGPIWSSNTTANFIPPQLGAVPNRLVMQRDGNLVAYNDRGGAPFATGTTGRFEQRGGPGTYLVMQDDGNLVEYTPVPTGRAASWASKDRSEVAIQWFYSNLRSKNYTGRCEGAVNTSFGTRLPFYASATKHWQSPSAGRQIVNDFAPRGSLVFWNTSADGHVGISLGNGHVVSTAGKFPANMGGGDPIGISPLKDYFRPYLGWKWSVW